MRGKKDVSVSYSGQQGGHSWGAQGGYTGGRPSVSGQYGYQSPDGKHKFEVTGSWARNLYRPGFRCPPGKYCIAALEEENGFKDMFLRLNKTKKVHAPRRLPKFIRRHKKIHSKNGGSISGSYSGSRGSSTYGVSGSYGSGGQWGASGSYSGSKGSSTYGVTGSVGSGGQWGVGGSYSGSKGSSTYGVSGSYGSSGGQISGSYGKTWGSGSIGVTGGYGTQSGASVGVQGSWRF